MARAIGTECGDCAAPVGQPHVDGCDVAQCTECGWQRISCEHEDADVGWGAIWTGEWPGKAECREYGWWCDDDPEVPGRWPDLNKLAKMARRDRVYWDRERQRWVLAVAGE